MAKEPDTIAQNLLMAMRTDISTLIGNVAGVKESVVMLKWVIAGLSTVGLVTLGNVYYTVYSLSSSMAQVQGVLGTMQQAQSSKLDAVIEKLDALIGRGAPPPDKPGDLKKTGGLPPIINGWIGTQVNNPESLTETLVKATKDPVWVYTTDPDTAALLQSMKGAGPQK